MFMVICCNYQCMNYKKVFHMIDIGNNEEENEQFAEQWEPQDDPCPKCGLTNVILEEE